MSLVLQPVPPRSPLAQKCPIRDILDCIGDRWSVLVLATLRTETLRFTALRRAIGDISPRMLAQTVRTLERDGYVRRKVYPTIPPKVEYSLTPLGRSLLQRLDPLVDWASAHHNDVRKARRAYVPPAASAAL